MCQGEPLLGVQGLLTPGGLDPVVLCCAVSGAPGVGGGGVLGHGTGLRASVEEGAGGAGTAGDARDSERLGFTAELGGGALAVGKLALRVPMADGDGGRRRGGAEEGIAPRQFGKLTGGRMDDAMIAPGSEWRTSSLGRWPPVHRKALADPLRGRAPGRQHRLTVSDGDLNPATDPLQVEQARTGCVLAGVDEHRGVKRLYAHQLVPFQPADPERVEGGPDAG